MKTMDSLIQRLCKFKKHIVTTLDYTLGLMDFDGGDEKKMNDYVHDRPIIIEFNGEKIVIEYNADTVMVLENFIQELTEQEEKYQKLRNKRKIM